ncbi:MAG TPA: TonB family protein [Candidatus Acidoferrales bacterium]|nr:TonB family protein [Candidatus Acidoferrales bacterium]
MTILVRSGRGMLRRLASFGISLCLHGVLLAWAILGPPLDVPEPRKTLYAQEIQPNEKKIVWYSLKEKLPDISPTDIPPDSLPPRAKYRAKQTIVSGPKDDPDATQRIWMPAPEVATPKPLPLPNVIAVAPPKVTRPFETPPDIIQPPKPDPAVPEAPKPAEVLQDKPLPVQAAGAKPKPLPFTAPPEKASAPKPLQALPDAPKTDSQTVAAAPLPIEATGAKPKPLAFTPPPDVRMQRQAAIPLPDAPLTATMVEPNALPFEGTGPRPQRRAYVPPSSGGTRQMNDAPAALPNAPEVSSAAGVGAVGLKGVPKTFTAPPSRPAAGGAAPAISADAPSLSGPASAIGNAELAIVGLNPANMTEVPPPPGSRMAGFSAGPEPVSRQTGGMGSAGGAALLGVPGLLVRGGANDAQSTLAAVNLMAPRSAENLIAAARSVTPATAAAPKPPPEASTPRIAEAPDPRLAGRVVYAVAIQMPNVTSFSGSWLVWFAEHEPVPGAPPMEMKAPVPLHKVDPKYIAAAAAERIEGKVRLFGVIRRDGHVDGIALIHHVDARLDRSATEALGQWVFEPAQRNGRPVEVDAVFEIPFHLAPRVTK